MANNNRVKTVNLDDLSSGRLPEHVLLALGKMKLSLSEMEQWEETKPNVRFTATEDQIVVEMKLRFPVKSRKFIVTVGALGTLVGATINLVVSNWSNIQTIFNLR